MSTFRLIYRSHNRIPTLQRKAELGDIFSQARSNNATLDVTGALLVRDDWFVQTLEGDETTVQALYDRIHKDVRHERVSVIESGEVDQRVFPRWSMARVSADGQQDIPLLANAAKGGIAAAASRPTTPEQDAVLDVMRHAIADESQTV